MEHFPSVSVVVAAYNRSSVLKYAISSILNQTFCNYEVLVVGDGCTDDSAEVVDSFHDPRLSWFNLAKNHGNQFAPNNFGIEKAKGKYIAYLGQDDLWWNTHLETLLETVERTGADVVAALALLFGPPESGVFSITGHMPGGRFTDRCFFPPSSLLHTRSLVEKIGRWRPPAEAVAAVDYDLLLRFRDNKATFACTNDLTVFKPVAAWRRGSYLDNSEVEHAAMMNRIQVSDERFRVRQLISFAKSAIEQRTVDPGSFFFENRQKSAENDSAVRSFKGVGPLIRNSTQPNGGSHISFYVEDVSLFEWHRTEYTERAGQFRWTGPGRASSFSLPITVKHPTRIVIRVIRAIQDHTLSRAVLRVNNQVLGTTIEATNEDAFLWSAILDPHVLGPHPIDLVTIHVAETFTPRDLGIGTDRRWLGLAVGVIRLYPDSRDASLA